MDVVGCCGCPSWFFKEPRSRLRVMDIDEKEGCSLLKVFFCVCLT